MSQPNETIKMLSLLSPGSQEHTELTDPERGIPRVRLDFTIRGPEDASKVLGQAQALGLNQHTIDTARPVLEFVLSKNPDSLTAVTALYRDIAAGTVFVTQNIGLSGGPEIPMTDSYLDQLALVRDAIDNDPSPLKHEPLIAIHAPENVLKQLVNQQNTLQLGSVPFDQRPKSVRENYEEFIELGIFQYKKDGTYVTVCPSQGLVVVSGSPGIPRQLAERKPSQD